MVQLNIRDQHERLPDVGGTAMSSEQPQMIADLLQNQA
jgi:hypothetical protein